MVATKESSAPQTETFTRVCECKNCGNEAEMVVTCSLAPAPATENQSQGRKDMPQGKGRKGTAHCSHCGGEADIWLEEV